MFLNLIKNELKSTIKNYLIVYLAFIASTIIAAIFIVLKAPVVLLFISISTIYICLLALLVIVFINIVKMSSKDMYDSQGFLTFSLPVSNHQLVLSKILVSILYTLLTSITIYLACYIFVVILNPESALDYIKSLFSKPFTYYIMSMVWSEATIIEFICLLQYVNSLGNSSFIRRKSAGKTVLLFFAMTIVLNIVSIILHVMIPYDVYFVIEANTGEIICEATSGGAYIENGFSLFELISNICISVIFYFLTIYNLNKKLDL